MSTHAMSISEFMSGDYKVKKKKKRNYKKVLAASPLLPLMAVPSISKSYAQEPVAVPAVADGTMNALVHALDPVIDLMVTLSLPICSLVIVGSFFYLAFGNEEKCWSGVMRGSLAFILIQMSPIFLKVLEQIGKSV